MAREGGSDFIRVVCAYFLPPLGVFLQCGIGMQLLLSLVLTFLFWLPGTFHALWVITNTTADGQANPEGGSDFVALVVGFFLPPVGVAIRKGLGLSLLVSCVLTFFFWFPGQIHAAWVVCSED
jgi:uncharacterized membrane protein YqaE (UPF0057 family)